MKLALVLAVGFLVTTVGAAASAETVAILPVSGINIHPSYCQVAQELLKDHLATAGKHNAVVVSGPTNAHEPSPAEAVQAARGVGADLALLAHLTHLQSTFRMRVTVYRVATGETVYTDALGASGGPDQLDPVIRRLMQAFARGERASDNAEIDNVTASEAEPYLKQTATRTVGLRVGGIMPFNRPAGDVGVGASLGLFWLYDARDYMAEAFVEITPNEHTREDSVNAFAIGIGLYRPFSRKNFTPYAGGGAAYSYSQFGGLGSGGLRLHGAFGLLFGRLSTVQIRGELGYFVNAYRESSDPAYADHNEAERRTMSHGPMFNVGIGF